MLDFKFKNVRISFLFSFFALFAVLFYSNDALKILSALMVCLIHEGAHLLAMFMYDCKPQRVLFYGGGIKIVPNCRIVSYEKEMIINLAGCFVNLVSGIILLRFGVLTSFAQASVVLGIFNLLPFSCFDGGHILKLIFEKKLNENYNYWYGLIVKMLCFVILFSGIYCFVYFKINLSLAVTICYIIISELFS